MPLSPINKMDKNKIDKNNKIDKVLIAACRKDPITYTHPSSRIHFLCEIGSTMYLDHSVLLLNVGCLQRP